MNEKDRNTDGQAEEKRYYCEDCEVKDECEHAFDDYNLVRPWKTKRAQRCLLEAVAHPSRLL